MTIARTIDRTKWDVFHWRFEASIPTKIVMAIGIAAITGLLAQARIPLPWSPVPITGQTFAVLLAGVALGRWWGGVAMMVYAAAGIAGVPWFNGFTSGLGATGGYIIGFVLAALFLGYFTDKFVRSRSFISMLALMLFANFVLIYGPGLLWLSVWLNVVPGTPAASVWALLAMGMTPFIAGDITKAVLAALVVRGITPKTSYGKEVDAHKWASWRLP